MFSQRFDNDTVHHINWRENSDQGFEKLSSVTVNPQTHDTQCSLNNTLYHQKQPLNRLRTFGGIKLQLRDFDEHGITGLTLSTVLCSLGPVLCSFHMIVNFSHKYTYNIKSNGTLGKPVHLHGVIVHISKSNRISVCTDFTSTL